MLDVQFLILSCQNRKTLRKNYLFLRNKPIFLPLTVKNAALAKKQTQFKAIFAQVIEETTIDGTDLTRIQYTIGDDVISQTKSTSTDGGINWTVEDVAPNDGYADTEYMLYDGHGSTRQLANSSGSIITGQNYVSDGNFDCVHFFFGFLRNSAISVRSISFKLAMIFFCHLL